MAAISALEALKKPCVVDLTTDSQYVRQGITGWIHGWKRNGWRTADKKPVKNVELWQRLDAALKPHEVRWHWIKGHAGHAENERADQLARDGVAMARLKREGGVSRATRPHHRHAAGDGVSLRSTPILCTTRTLEIRDQAIQLAAHMDCFASARRDDDSLARKRIAYSCPSSVSPPETSTLPGAGSRLSFLTTPSSTSIE